MMSILIMATFYQMKVKYKKLLLSKSTLVIALLSMYLNRFEKAMESPQLYAKTLNNLATMYYRMGKFCILQYPEYLYSLTLFFLCNSTIPDILDYKVSLCINSCS